VCQPAFGALEAEALQCLCSFQVTVSTVDKRKNLLVYKAHVIEMGNKMVLLDFRLSRGDGLEFKRHFVRLKEKLNISEWKGPVAWLT
jgi:serine/threonine-protein kinase Chk1